ncbi:hypothetical protein HY468_05745 [Candidatus Roizmanbacteria bacterium]|nr:hypothetical protein [Candidatus Roizmanbacteria bacterium]
MAQGPENSHYYFSGEEGLPQNPQEQRGLEHVALVARIQEIQKDNISRAYFIEVELGRLLPALEETGIVPVVESPNPYNPEVDKEKFEQWITEHQKEMDEFRRNLEKHEEILTYLYFGATLDRFLDELIPQRKSS